MKVYLLIMRDYRWVPNDSDRRAVKRDVLAPLASISEYESQRPSSTPIVCGFEGITLKGDR
jgi:hypothetical protein